MSDPIPASLNAPPVYGTAAANRCALSVMLASTVFAALSVGTHLGLQGLRVQHGHFGLPETNQAPATATTPVYAPAMIGPSH
jgi:hypothetical protein